MARAALSAGKESGRSFVEPFGVPGGFMDCYIGVPLELGEGTCVPDGLVRVALGSKPGTALVEVRRVPTSW